MTHRHPTHHRWGISLGSHCASRFSIFFTVKGIARAHNTLIIQRRPVVCLCRTIEIAVTCRPAGLASETRSLCIYDYKVVEWLRNVPRCYQYFRSRRSTTHGRPTTVLLPLSCVGMLAEKLSTRETARGEFEDAMRRIASKFSGASSAYVTHINDAKPRKESPRASPRTVTPFGMVNNRTVRYFDAWGNETSESFEGRVHPAEYSRA